MDDVTNFTEYSVGEKTVKFAVQRTVAISNSGGDGCGNAARRVFGPAQTCANWWRLGHFQTCSPHLRLASCSAS